MASTSEFSGDGQREVAFVGAQVDHDRVRVDEARVQGCAKCTKTTWEFLSRPEVLFTQPADLQVAFVGLLVAIADQVRTRTVKAWRHLTRPFFSEVLIRPRASRLR